MCAGIALGWRELPEVLIDKYRLSDRKVIRNGDSDPEIQFLFRHPRPLLPAWIDSQLIVCHWGNQDRHSRLPRTGWINSDELDRWIHAKPKLIQIPANYGFEKGIWYQIIEGIKGVLVCDERRVPHVYMLTEPASHYYNVMTRSRRMPVFMGQQI
jgi:hypothetical protein